MGRQPLTPKPAPEHVPYSVGENARHALQILLRASQPDLPAEFMRHVQDVVFVHGPAAGDSVCLPCPLRQQEACAALKALEGCAIAAIADLQLKEHRKEITVNLGRVTCFLMSAYITTLDGLDKSDPKISHRLPGLCPLSALCFVY